MGKTVDQPSLRPTRKVRAAGVGGAIGIIAVWVLNMFLAEPVPSEVASAIATLASVAVAYVTREQEWPTSSAGNAMGRGGGAGTA